ncbi:phage portal protein [Streptomyces sp. NPDC017966]|uniref:phage portal protein n=1 Tax=Streptomyces sp. NPDC017966 TaxID=3365023 RepID=UPI0037A59F5C
MVTAWPPPELAEVFAQQDIWSAWYAGTPEGLADAYLNAPNDRPAVRRKGFLARLGRWFWGQPTPIGERPSKLHVPLAGAIAATSANLLFGSPLNLTTDDKATQERLDQLADDTTYAVLREAAEICAALGGVYLRVVWDQSVQDKPWLVAASPDIAVPEWKWGRLSAVTFWNVIREDANTVVRQLERHEPGWIRHSVWVGSQNELGTQMALTDFPETAGLADLVIDGDSIPTGTFKLTAQYVPNLKPNKLWRHLPAAGHLGRSDFSGVEALMDALDEAYSDWMRDLRTGKARLLVGTEVLDNLGRGQGGYFDIDRELFAPLNLAPGEDSGSVIEQVQFNIRTEEHRALCADLAERIILGASYSLQTFGVTSKESGNPTATEIAARERQSLTTRANKASYWRPALAHLFGVLLEIDRAVFGTSVIPVEPHVEFPDLVAPDPSETAEQLDLLSRAGAISTFEKVRRLNPDWREEQVLEEVARIREESTPAAEPTELARRGLETTRSVTDSKGPTPVRA